MSGGFSLGFPSRVYRPTFDPQVYRDTLELFRVAEELGFDSGWVAQRHFASEQGCLSGARLGRDAPSRVG